MIVNWIYNRKEITSIDQLPEEVIGFVYKITNITNNKVYYGKKLVRSVKKKKLTKAEKLIPENKRKTFKYELSEYSGWKKYTGSNEYLNEDIKKGNKYKKEIVKLCKSKAEMTYEELKLIICEDCLKSENCYNAWVSAKVFSRML